MSDRKRRIGFKVHRKPFDDISAGMRLASLDAVDLIMKHPRFPAGGKVIVLTHDGHAHGSIVHGGFDSQAEVLEVLIKAAGATGKDAGAAVELLLPETPKSTTT